MAEGGRGLECLQDLEKALPSTSTSTHTQPQLEPVRPVPPLTVSFETKVLCWNIKGKGTAECRNRLVPRVVERLNPDVLLLQEIPSDKIIYNCIFPYCQDKRGRKYCFVNASERSEARVVYDDSVFELVMGDGQTTKRLDISAAVRNTVEPPEDQRATRSGRGGGMEEVFEKRAVAARLRHRATGKELVFMSFHNIRNGKETASEFCQLVCTIAETETTLVVSGADLNTNTFTRGAATVPRYRGTGRRKTVDYIILSPPPTTINVQGEVTAEDIFPEDDSDHTHPYSTVYEQLRRGNGSITVANCKSSLDHDPLVYDVTLTYN